MKLIFMSSKFDNRNVYWNALEAEETVITMRHLIHKINENIMKRGAIYTHVDPLLQIAKLGKKDGES